MRAKPSAGLIATLGVLAAALAAAGVARLIGEEKEPYYVGARVCGSCHHGKSMGNQHGLWLISKHSRAYAVLAKPEAKEIIRLSGITQEPQEAAMCLGCHATAAEAEKWEKDTTFFTGDGVQCEKCHGPGSEYMDVKVMMNRDAAMKAGLKMPTQRDCMACHTVKGSHIVVHKIPQHKVQEAWKAISHAPPPDWSYTPEPAKNKAPEPAKGLKYVGVENCAQCHDSPAMGHQFSRWRMSAHARAYAELTTPAAYARAQEKGVSDEPPKSPACLKCHATACATAPGASLPSFSVTESVGCERCHGAGSEYSLQAIMLDKRAAAAAGLKQATKTICLECHEKAHEKPFDVDSSWTMIAHSARAGKTPESPAYKTPLQIALRPGSRELFVACEASGTVAIVDTSKRQKVAEIPVGGQATEVAFNPDGSLAFVTSRLKDSVAVIDTAARKVIRTIAVGDEPHGLQCDRTGAHLYVLNTSEDSISVVDIASGKEIKRLAASRSPWSAALSPDGRTMLVTNNLSRFVNFRDASKSEITVVDTEQVSVGDRVLAPQANYMQGIAWHPSGEFALCTLVRTKNLVPMTRVV